jgi:lysophospholipase L1-like esterase
MPYPAVIVTGDSIAQMSFKAGGYGSALTDLVGSHTAISMTNEQYQGNYDVLNRGMGGYNSNQLVQRLEEGLDVSTGADVRMIIVHIGTNDW